MEWQIRFSVQACSCQLGLLRYGMSYVLVRVKRGVCFGQRLKILYLIACMANFEWSACNCPPKLYLRYVHSNILAWSPKPVYSRASSYRFFMIVLLAFYISRIDDTIGSSIAASFLSWWRSHQAVQCSSYHEYLGHLVYSEDFLFDGKVPRFPCTSW